MWCRSTPGTWACTCVSTMTWRSAYFWWARVLTLCTATSCSSSMHTTHRACPRQGARQAAQVLRSKFRVRFSVATANSNQSRRSSLYPVTHGHGRALDRYATGHVWTHLIDAGALFTAPPPPWALMTVVVVIICGCCTGIICGCCMTICGCCMAICGCATTGAAISVGGPAPPQLAPHPPQDCTTKPPLSLARTRKRHTSIWEAIDARG